MIFSNKSLNHKYANLNERVAGILLCCMMLAYGQLAAQQVDKRLEPNTFRKSTLLSGRLLETTSNLKVAYGEGGESKATLKSNCTESSFTHTVLFELEQDILRTTGRFSATLRFTYGNSMTTGALGTSALTLVYDKGDVRPEQSRQVFVLENATDLFEIWDITIEIVDLATGQVMDIAGYSQFLRTQVELSSNTRCAFNCTSCIVNLSAVAQAPNAINGDKILVSWGALDGAIEYDLEWVYLDDYDATTLGLNLIPDFDKNAARVTLKGTNYSIPNIYENGFVVFRVRARGLSETAYKDGGNSLVEGKWSNECLPNYHPQMVISLFPHAQFVAVQAHEGDKLNWQLVSTFAEEGKRKDVVSYYDGAMYNRQTVTLNSTDGHAIVAEQYYDHLGRASLTALPGPVNDARLRFYNSFNQNVQGQPYGKADFDLNSSTNLNSCFPEMASMSPLAGTSKYYSPNNDFTQFSHRSLIPDAQGLPYIRTLYTPDATGRVARVGNVGPEFQMGRGHDTKYEYSTPSQRELDELFGNNVGYAEHYKRETVQDPNGQRSLTYKDAHGRTIATALAGISPDNLGELESNAPSQKEVTESLISPTSQKVDNYCIDTRKSVTVDKLGNNHFSYSLEAPENNIACFSSSICFNCIYDLRIQIYKQDCQELLYDSQPLLVGKPLMPNPKCDPSQQIGGGSPSSEPCEILNTACEGGLGFQLTGGIDLMLAPGNYLVVKTLCVSQKAADDYVEFYLASNEPNCVSTYDQFLEDAIEEMEAEGCSDDICSPSSPAAADFLGEYQPCDTLPNLCESVKRQMLLDMTPPFGQYALMRPDPSVPAPAPNAPLPAPQAYIADDYLSAFNVSSVLGRSSTASSYRDFYFTIEKGSTSQYLIPSPLNGSLVPINHPDVPLETVLAHWKKHWAETLLPLHPESCMMEFCEHAEESFEFDAMIANASYNEATGNGRPVGTPTLLDAGNPSLFAKDPLFKGIYDFSGGTLPSPGPDPVINHLVSWTPSNGMTKSQWLWENANYHYNHLNDRTGTQTADLLLGTLMAAHCMHLSPSQLSSLTQTQIDALSAFPLSCSPPTDLAGYQPDLAISSENRWYAYKANYLSVKSRIMEHLMKRWMENNGCKNDCIPVPAQATENNAQLQPAPAAGTSNSLVPTLPRQNPEPPCNEPTARLYQTKTKRFLFSDDVRNSMSPRPDMDRNYGDPTDVTHYPLGNSGYSLDESGVLNGVMANSQLPGCEPTVVSPCAPTGGGSKTTGTILECDEIQALDLYGLVSAILDPTLYPSGSNTLNLTGSLLTNGLLVHINGGNTLPNSLPISEMTNSTHQGRVFLVRGMVANLMVTIPTQVFQSRSIAWSRESLNIQELPGNFRADVVLGEPSTTQTHLISIVANTPIAPWCADPCPEDAVTEYTNDPAATSPNSTTTTDHCQICDPLYNTDVTAEAEPCSLRIRRLAEATALYEYNRYLQDLRQTTRRAYLDKCIQATDKMARIFDDSRHHFTLYYYDQSGMLVATVPPAGVKQLSDSDIQAVASYRDNALNAQPIYPAHTKLTQYWFNGMGGAYKQQTPDGGISTFYFDYLGRIIASQDADQANPSSYNGLSLGTSGRERISYTIYDLLGRSTEAGQAAVNQILSQLLTNGGYEDYSNFLLNINSNAFEKLERTTTSYDVEDPNIPPYIGQTNLRGRVSASQSFERGQSTPSNLVMYSYDVHGNVERISNQTYEPIRFSSDVEYDYDLLSGKVNEVVYNRGRVDQLVHRYEYDADNRLKKVQTSRDGVLWDEDARYFYYPHGPLARTELGEHMVQGNDYTYTLQGWIKGVNTASLNAQYDPSQDSYTQPGAPAIGRNWRVARDAVGYNLHYRQDDYRSIGYSDIQPRNGIQNWYGDLWNGNIRAMTTAIRPFMNDDDWYKGDVPTIHRGPANTSYRYDQLNRIASSIYFQGFDQNLNSWRDDVPMNKGDRYYNAYRYDADGNILALMRNGTKEAYINGNQHDIATNGQLEMDELRYSYNAGSNRLMTVEDGQSNDAAYTDNPANTYDAADFDGVSKYEYHANGALFLDQASQGGTYVLWNMLQKPRYAFVDKAGSLTRYFYTPSGQRLAKLNMKDNIFASLTLYQRDATGNVLGTYQINSEEEFKEYSEIGFSNALQSHTIYGSSRLAEWRREASPNITGGEIDGQGQGGDNEKLKTKETLDARLETLDSLGKKPKANSEKFDFARIKERSAKIEAMLARTAEASMASPYVRVQTHGYEIMQKNIPPDTTQTEKSASFVKQNDEVRIYTRVIVWKRYELSNHLGNVLATITDRKVIRGGDYSGPKKMEKGGQGSPLDDLNLALAIEGAFFEPDVATADDYYPFGMAMPGRTWKAREADGYRYGFGGHEESTELGDGMVTTEYREMDTHIGRWLSLDPIVHEWQSPFCLNDNSPIMSFDPDGRSTNNEYRRYQNEKGEWVNQEISKKGGNNYDIIHTEYGRIPEKNASVETVRIDNPNNYQPGGEKGGARMEPGQWQKAFSVYDDGPVISEDISEFTPNPKSISKAGVSLLMLAVVKEGAEQAGKKATGYVAKKVWKGLEKDVQKRAKAALKKGIVGPEGETGIIKLTASELKEQGYKYTHKLKIRADMRIYGNKHNGNHYLFDSEQYNH